MFEVLKFASAKYTLEPIIFKSFVFKDIDFISVLLFNKILLKL